MFLEIVIYFILIAIVVTLLSSIREKHIWNRILCLSLVSTKVTMIIIIFSIVNNTSFFIDIGIVYMLLGFIGTTFMAMFFRRNEDE